MIHTKRRKKKIILPLSLFQGLISELLFYVSIHIQKIIVVSHHHTQLQQSHCKVNPHVKMQGETKEDLPTATVKKARFSYISEKILLQFQPSVDPNDIPYEQIAWWKSIFSYIQPNDYERLHLRRLCNMFKASLKAPPKGKWTEYPHLNHPSIDSLFNRCKESNSDSARNDHQRIE